MALVRVAGDGMVIAWRRSVCGSKIAWDDLLPECRDGWRVRYRKMKMNNGKKD
jgi:hypothetical protein